MIVELTGLELLTNAFGVLLMFQGVAAAVGSPLLGKHTSALSIDNKYQTRLTVGKSYYEHYYYYFLNSFLFKSQ